MKIIQYYSKLFNCVLRRGAGGAAALRGPGARRDGRAGVRDRSERGEGRGGNAKECLEKMN